MKYYIALYFLAQVVLCTEPSSMNAKAVRMEKESGAWARSYFPNLLRRFAFPPKTFLIFIPELTLPAWRDRISADNDKPANDEYLSCDASSINGKEGVDDEYPHAVKNSDIQISSPFYLYFDKLGWTHSDSIFNLPAHVPKFIDEYFVNPALNLFGVPPRPANRNGEGKSGNGKIGGSPTSLSDLHRLQIFHKIEKLLEEVGVESGRSCLLRAICELHEFPFESGRFGMFGEILALVFGVLSPEALSDTPSKRKDGIGAGNGCMAAYAKAEKYGKAKDCLRYTKYCQHSIFQWFWKFPFQKII